MTELCPLTTIRVGKRELKVHLAQSPVQWRHGLVDHTTTGAAGMLFTMPRRSLFSFHIGPLDVPILLAFFDDNRQLVDIGYLDQTHPTMKPSVPYSYALELIDDYARLPLAGIVLRDFADGLELE